LFDKVLQPEQAYQNPIITRLQTAEEALKKQLLQIKRRLKEFNFRYLKIVTVG